MKKATARDVARLADVSVSTVSRYINRSAYIAKDKIDAIEQAMFDLNFKPKHTAHSSKTRRNMKIGVIIPSFSNAYVSAILNGMNHWAQAHAYNLHVESSQWRPVRERKIIKQMVDSGVDALVLLVSLLEEQDILTLVGELPILLIGNHGQALADLKIDNVIAASIATNHLIQLGHQRIVHLHGPLSESSDANERLQGYKKSLTQAGLALDPQLLLHGDYNDVQSYNMICQLIEKKVDFTAIFAANDLSAYGALQALHQYNIRVPEQVSVIGFDDLINSAMSSPPLSTVRQPLYAMGHIALDYICDMMSGNVRRPKLPPVELIIRASTAPAPRLN